jgi:hypothetical protein
MQPRSAGRGDIIAIFSNAAPASRSGLRGKERLALTFALSRDILGLLDILVDIGVLAEKEVIL